MQGGGVLLFLFYFDGFIFVTELQIVKRVRVGTRNRQCPSWNSFGIQVAYFLVLKVCLVSLIAIEFSPHRGP